VAENPVSAASGWSVRCVGSLIQNWPVAPRHADATSLPNARSVTRHTRADTVEAGSVGGAIEAVGADVIAVGIEWAARPPDASGGG